MITAIGTYGIEIHETLNADETVESIDVRLDSYTRNSLTFIDDLRAAAGYNGYDLGQTIRNMQEQLLSIQSQLHADDYYKNNNPAVKEAWENYQTMLGLAKEYDK